MPRTSLRLVLRIVERFSPLPAYQHVRLVLADFAFNLLETYCSSSESFRFFAPYTDVLTAAIGYVVNCVVILQRLGYPPDEYFGSLGRVVDCH